ncbi:MAG: hypothetical protein A2Z18_05395 [Armatimonadetes bacterium RBG_16_58_9]|nr:MAG: hypothetical protein A2Z18_05395 [Armatimonadetes bacterium RBG_16_58_9]
MRVSKNKITLDDGRYLIYFSFSDRFVASAAVNPVLPARLSPASLPKQRKDKQQRSGGRK